MHLSTLIPTISVLILGATAKLDLRDCVSTEVPYATRDTLVYRSLLWYLPDTGEICEFLDCGGGRAPPKTNVPGCGNYKGTDTYSPRYWTGFQAAATTAEEPVIATTTASNPARITTNLNTEGAVQSTTAPRASPTTLATVTESKTVTEDAQETAAPTGSGTGNGNGNGAEAQESGSSTATSSSTSSVVTAGAAPTGVRMIGVVAGVAAAGFAMVA
ncbi:hypothetical protein QBC44DRAFT_379712 [Cladorrhinum sp. PSN332]|nr:hypothetical protein QBC44DRAFT_379712 [Cladorrhinum sp. PSN332]